MNSRFENVRNSVALPPRTVAAIFINPARTKKLNPTAAVVGPVLTRARIGDCFGFPENSLRSIPVDSRAYLPPLSQGWYIGRLRYRQFSFCIAPDSLDTR